MPLQVFHSPEEWRERLGPSRSGVTVTVGNFDGLHRGHQQLLRGVVDRARQMGTLAAAITFDPHPLRILRPADAPPLIAGLAARLAGFEQLGLDAALVMKFDLALSRMSPKDFVQQVLVETLRTKLIRVGENFRFGHRHAGDVALLRELGGRPEELARNAQPEGCPTASGGFQVELVPPVIVRGVLVSSTAIREAVQQGRVGHAARLLGRPFAVTGKIQTGTGQGRQLLVPTLNLSTDQELLPRNGVYATETIVAGRKHPSATNVGTRPTFDGRHLTIESHVFGFCGELKEGPMEVHFWRRLRDEKKFPGVEDLRAQIEEDLRRARRFFRKLKNQNLERRT